MNLWQRIERGMEAGFDAALAAVHSITEKAGEGVEVTRLRREKARLETQITRLFAKLGGEAYERLSSEQRMDLAEQIGISEMLKELAFLDARMQNIDRKLSEELNKK